MPSRRGGRVVREEHRRAYIGKRVAEVLSELLSNAELMPVEWDENELSRYIAEKFMRADDGLLRSGSVRGNGCTKRIAAYRQAVMTRGL